MNWKYWLTDDPDSGPVQWPTREPVRARLQQDRVYPSASDWIAGLCFVVCVALLWVIGAAFGG